MRKLHVAPNGSAGGSLLQAIRDDGRDEDVAVHLDDLSWGPIELANPAERETWWKLKDGGDFERSLTIFWERVLTTDERLVVWFARHAASELAFFEAFVDRLEDRAYDVIDVTGLQFPFTRQDGTRGMSQAAQSVGTENSDALRSLFGSEREITAQQRLTAQQHWRLLRSENAPFRIVTEAGLASAPVDHFDPLLLQQATTEWRMVAYLVGATMGCNMQPYLQVGDLPLLERVVSLVEQGKLLADGDPWRMQSCRVRLPD